jgi:hypothetical protein
MADSAPEFAVEALATAIRGRDAAARPVGSAGRGTELAPEDGGAAGAFTLPDLTFKFSSPSFLNRRSRWVLFLGLLLIAPVALLLAWELVQATPDSAGWEWVLPPIMALIVAVFALAFAYATVMGFGNVELSTTIGESEADPTAGPSVKDTVPADKATDVAADVELEATFSEAIDPGSPISSSFVLRRLSDMAAVAATVSRDADGVTGRLKPTAPLEANTTYQAEITTAVRTADGKALAAGKTWTFTTAT